MEIQVINIYPNKNGNTGTVHVKVLPLNIDIKGVCYKKIDNKIEVFAPAFKYNGSNARIDCFGFGDKAINKAFKAQLKQVVKEALDKINQDPPPVPQENELILTLMKQVHELAKEVKSLKRDR